VKASCEAIECRAAAPARSVQVSSMAPDIGHHVYAQRTPRSILADAVKDIENFERGGGFKITKRISSPPRLEDFAQLQLPREDFADLRTCQVGDCALKLSAAGSEPVPIRNQLERTHCVRLCQSIDAAARIRVRDAVPRRRQQQSCRVP
jgi:hypothetical protein